MQQLVQEVQAEGNLQQAEVITRLEGTLLHFAQDVLQIEHIQADKNLYDYGADSLSLSQLAGKIKKVN